MLPVEINLMRIVAQGLVDATAAPTPTEVVRRQLAIQGQRVPSIPHAIVVRGGANRITKPDVDAAFDNRELVRSWPFRGTLHVTTADDHHWLRAVMMHKMAGWLRRIEALGADADTTAKATAAADALLDEKPALSRKDLTDAWAAVGISDDPRMTRSLLQALIVEGQLVQGPRLATEHLYVDARDLPDEFHGPAGAEGAAKTSPGYRRTLAEIARRFAVSHGPATARDLARWSGMTLTEAKRALEDAVDITNDPAYAVDPAAAHVPIMRATLEGNKLTEAPAGTPEALYFRGDLGDLVNENEKAARRALYLPAFDELHVGYGDRTCLTDEPGEFLICPSRNGIFRPIVVDRGRMVAVDYGRGDLRPAPGTRQSKRLTADTERAIARISQLI